MVLGDSTGGIGTHVASLSRALLAAHRPDAPGESAELALWAPPATLTRPALAALADRGVRLLPVERRWWRQRALLDDADIVHAHGFHAGSRVVALMRRRARSRLVTTWHNLPPLEPAASRIAGRSIAGLVAHGSRLSLGASADLVAVAVALGARDARVCEVSAPPLPDAVRTRDEVRQLLGIDGPMVLSVSRLAPQKNLGLLLDAWQQLVVRWRVVDPAARTPTLVIAGGGPIEAELRARVDADDLPVRLLGQRDDVADLLGAADIAVSASDWEARSLVAQEALRAGVPFVGTAVGGVPGLVGDAGILVPSRDADALATGILTVLTEPTVAARLHNAGPARAAEWPNEAQTAAFVWSCYADVLAGPPVLKPSTDTEPATPAVGPETTPAATPTGRLDEE
jgi:glycosyltransferase involved in cell wall biosynthesis